MTECGDPRARGGQDRSIPGESGCLSSISADASRTLSATPSPTEYDALDGLPSFVVPGWVFCRTCTISSATRSNSSWPKAGGVSGGVPKRAAGVFQGPVGAPWDGLG